MQSPKLRPQQEDPNWQPNPPAVHRELSCILIGGACPKSCQEGRQLHISIIDYVVSSKAAGMSSHRTANKPAYVNCGVATARR